MHTAANNTHFEQNDLYDLFPLDVDISRQLFFRSCIHDLPHVAGWDQKNLHDRSHVSWVGSVAAQILHNLSQKAGEELDELHHDLSHV